MKILETKRLYFRPFGENDLDILFQLHANPEVAKTTIDGIQGKEAIKKHLDAFVAHQKKLGYSQWAAFEKESDKFIGRAGLTLRSLNKEIGEQTEIRFAFLPEFWGKGYASEVTVVLIKFGFENLKLNLISASSGMDNEKSYRVLTKNGFKFVKNIIAEGYGKADEIRYYILTRDEFLKIK